MYKFIYHIGDNYISTSDPEPEPRHYYEVHCGRCSWWGYKKQLKPVYIIHERSSPGCPMCLSSEWIEYEED